MAAPTFIIRPPLLPDELTEHIKGDVEVDQSFSPDPLPEDTATRFLRRLTTYPGYRPIVRVIQQREYTLSYDVATVLTILFPTGQTWIPASDWF